MIKRYKDIVDCYDKGAVHYTSWRKVPSQVTTAGAWFDLSLSPGNPVPQYYASSPMVGKAMKLSDQGGFFHRGAVAPLTKYLAKMTMIANSAVAVGTYTLCDYLYYYPFIDEGTQEEQLMDNTETIPRLEAGGAQIMAVSVAPRNGNARFQVRYTNQDGVEGRMTDICISTANNANGTLINTGTVGIGTGNRTSPFLPLQGKDISVLKIEGVTVIDPDVGLFALVLVRPLANIAITNISGPTEVEFFRDSKRLPEIQDDAFLGLVGCPAGSLNGVVLMGDFNFIFG